MKNDHSIVYNFNSYKSFLRAKANQERGLLTQMAKAAGCERSYFSRVLADEVHLTPDHAFRLSQFLNFNSQEQEYFLLLVENERSGDKKYQLYLTAKMNVLKREYEDLSKRTQNPIVNVSEIEIKYQSHWLNTALHVLTSIPEFQTVEKLSQKLQVSMVVVKKHLNFLLECGYVEFDGKKYSYKTGAGHISKNSSLSWLHHQNWRQMAVEDANNSETKGLHFTNVQSVSKKDFEFLKDMVLDLISKMGKISDPSKPEEMMIFNCDFFSLEN